MLMRKSAALLPDSIHLPGTEIYVMIRPSMRASRITVRIRSGHAELVLPHGADYQKAVAFVHSKKQWIISKLAIRQVAAEHHPLTDGATITVLGEELTIRHTGSRRGATYREGKGIYVSGDSEHLPRRVSDYLQGVLHEEIVRRATAYSNRLGCKFRKVVLRDTMSRWGSCSSSGTLSFSWRLIFAPLAVLDYVIIHEVCHLKEMNHGDQFWQTVASLCPNYVEYRSWLKRHGDKLHHY